MTVPNKSMEHISSIKSSADFINGQLIGMCAQWPEGLDGRAQFVRNLRSICSEMAGTIEKLDTEIFRPSE